VKISIINIESPLDVSGMSSYFSFCSLLGGFSISGTFVFNCLTCGSTNFLLLICSLVDGVLVFFSGLILLLFVVLTMDLSLVMWEIVITEGWFLLVNLSIENILYSLFVSMLFKMFFLMVLMNLLSIYGTSIIGVSKSTIIVVNKAIDSDPLNLILFGLTLFDVSICSIDTLAFFLHVGPLDIVELLFFAESHVKLLLSLIEHFVKFFGHLRDLQVLLLGKLIIDVHFFLSNSVSWSRTRFSVIVEVISRDNGLFGQIDCRCLTEKSQNY